MSPCSRDNLLGPYRESTLRNLSHLVDLFGMDGGPIPSCQTLLGEKSLREHSPELGDKACLRIHSVPLCRSCG